MKFKRIHFFYNPKKRRDSALARNLMKGFPQTPIEDADLIVSIGGDGTALEALQKANGTPVYGLTPATSNSHGFWTDHNVKTAEQLTANLKKATVAEVAPLKAEITLGNGKKSIIYAFNDVVVKATSGQSIIINLTAEFSKSASFGPNRIMGDGLIFSTGRGSTGIARSYMGPTMDLLEKEILITSIGIANAGRSMVVGEDTVLAMDFSSVAQKRPMHVEYDGHSISYDPRIEELLLHLKGLPDDLQRAPITRVVVSTAKDHAALMVVTEDPRAKAFNTMFPAK